jgi:hypothetical protein
MNSLFELEQKRSKASKRYHNKERKLQEQIDLLEKKRKSLTYPHLIDYLNKLGKAVVLSRKIKGAVGFEVYGPFGLNNECSIYFKSGDRKTKTLASATFSRHGDGYGLKDYSKNSGHFPKGSIGELNGGNYKVIEITKEMTLDWFVKFSKKGFNR